MPNSDKNQTRQKTTDSAKSIEQLNIPPEKTVIDFLKWYKENYQPINDIELIYLAPGDTIIPYSVDAIGTKKYLEYFENSGYVSKNYIKYWSNYFLERQQYFEDNLEFDGPPSGFEFDFVLLTQEVDEVLDSIENPEILNSEITKNQAIVKINISMRLSFCLTKSNNQWLIDKIENIGLE